MSDTHDDEMTIGDARLFIQANCKEGVRCPCCGRHTRVYKRPLNATMARQLIVLHRWFLRSSGERWVHASTLFRSLRMERECAKLCFWGLIEKAPGEDPNGSPHSGYFRITDEGHLFAQQQRRVPKFIYLLNNELLGHSTEVVTVGEALRKRFDYTDLMTARIEWPDIVQ